MLHPCNVFCDWLKFKFELQINNKYILIYADAKNCMAHACTKKKNLNTIFSINVTPSTAWVILILKYYLLLIRNLYLTECHVCVLSLSICVWKYIHMYMYTHTYLCIYAYN